MKPQNDSLSDKDRRKQIPESGYPHTNIKRCGVQLIYTHDYLHDNVPMLVDHQRGHDDAGENQADDQEPHPKRLRASSTDLKL